MVLGYAAQVVVAKAQHGRIIHRELDRVSNLPIIIRLVGYSHAGHDSAGRQHLSLDEIHAIEDRDIVTRRLVIRVHFAGFEPADHGVGIVAVVDKFDVI